jgi:hypothetical protein
MVPGLALDAIGGRIEQTYYHVCKTDFLLPLECGNCDTVLVQLHVELPTPATIGNQRERHIQPIGNEYRNTYGDRAKRILTGWRAVMSSARYHGRLSDWCIGTQLAVQEPVNTVTKFVDPVPHGLLLYSAFFRPNPDPPLTRYLQTY